MEKKLNKNFFQSYLAHAPIALARERALELYLMQSVPAEGMVLDIACGDGFYTHMLFPQIDKTIYGIDLNPKEIEKAMSIKTFKKVSVMDATKLEFPSGSFNTVFSNSSLEHIKEIEKSLHSIHRVLAENGKLFLTLPTDKFEMYSAGATFLEFLNLKKISIWYRKKYNLFWNHFHTHNVEGWIIIFNNTGFEVVESIEYATHKFCLLNDLMTPQGLIGKINMMIFNKWKIAEPLWKYISKYLRTREPFDVKKEINISNGGLVYFELKKSQK